MKRLVTTTVVGAALTLALAPPAGAGLRTHWVCDVGEPPPVVFVSADDHAYDGISKANTKAGAVFAQQFGESCTVELVSD
jgi:hypothetical protein